MPAIGNITINDGATTPVAHTFGVVSTDGKIASYADRSGGVPAEFPLIKVSSSVPAGTQRFYRVVLSVSMPKAATDPQTGKSYIARQTQCRLEFTLPETGVLQERKDILAYSKNLLALAMVTSLVQDLETVY
jgi:hypothetical protein